MNRYQKPELYELLALEYCLGTLHGGARKRFESLMQERPYLETTVDRYNFKFAELTELLPRQAPNKRVWDNISKQINNSPSDTHRAELAASGNATEGVRIQDSWWQSLWGKGVLAMVLLLVMISAMFLNTSQTIEATAFTATLVAENSQRPMVDVHVARSDLKMTIKFKEPVLVPKGMKVVFWCIAKDKSTPIMNMGTVASQGITEKKLPLSGWQGIVDASMFAVSIEPANSTKNSSPSGELLFVGKLKALTRT